jgi:asparagine synthase (glutamine-hydrolysing)
LRYLDRWGVPLPVPGHFLWEPLLVAAARDGAECMLDGELGDEVFGAAVFLIADRLRHGRLRGAVRLARSFPAAGPSPSRRLLLSALYDYGIAVCVPSGLSRVTAAPPPTPSWLSRDEARRYAQSRDPQPWRSLEGPRWWRQLADALTRGPDRLGFFDYFRRRGRAVGVPAHHPFADLELIELVLTLPPEHAFAPDLSRPLLRHAMRGLLPDEIRARRGKSYFDPLLVDCLAGCDRRVIGALLSPRHAEVLRFADPTAIRLLLDRGPAGHPRGAVPWMRDVWRLATAECWLRSQSNPEIAHAILDELSRTLEGGASGWRPRAGSPARSYVSQS